MMMKTVRIDCPGLNPARAELNYLSTSTITSTATPDTPAHLCLWQVAAKVGWGAACCSQPAWQPLSSRLPVAKHHSLHSMAHRELMSLPQHTGTCWRPTQSNPHSKSHCGRSSQLPCVQC